MSGDFSTLTPDHLSIFKGADVAGRVVRVDVGAVVRREDVEVDGLLNLDGPEEEAAAGQKLPDGPVLPPVLEDPDRCDLAVAVGSWMFGKITSL